MTLTEFLLARIAEDEDCARDHLADWVAPYDEGLRWHPDVDGESDMLCIHPGRVLAECEANRRIVEDFEDYASEYRKAPSDFAAGRRHAALLAVTRIAAIYADHADYLDEWRP